MTETWRSAQLAALLDELAMLDSLADVVERSVSAAHDEVLSPHGLADGAVSIVVRHERIVLAPGRTEPGTRPAALERSSDPRLSEAVAVQAKVVEGPGYDIVHGAAMMLSTDLAQARFWPQWSPLAVSLGWRSWIAFQLLDRHDGLMGVLTIAHPRADAVDAELADRLADWSAHLSVAVDAVRQREAA